jgi:hypothetical protein
LVDWINSISDRHKLSMTSLHLAVYLLDFFMDNFDVSKSQLNLLSMGCLSVATKFEEKEEDIPKQGVLSHYCGGSYTPTEFLQMELMLLKFFDWEVGLVTPAHFISFYVTHGCPEVDLPSFSLVDVDLKSQLESVRNYARYFMTVCIQVTFVIWRKMLRRGSGNAPCPMPHALCPMPHLSKWVDKRRRVKYSCVKSIILPVRYFSKH